MQRQLARRVASTLSSSSSQCAHSARSSHSKLSFPSLSSSSSLFLSSRRNGATPSARMSTATYPLPSSTSSSSSNTWNPTTTTPSTSSSTSSTQLKYKVPLLTNEQLAFWDKNGYLVAGNVSSMFGIGASVLASWVDDFAKWDKLVKDKWLLHHEELPSGAKVLCRVENFADHHSSAGQFLRGPVLHVASQLYREPAVLFKEKVNFKMAGGAGFAAHQDTPAYIGLANSHISVMVAIDAATLENGCLQVSAGRYSKGQIPLTPSGVVQPAFDATLKYDYVECAPGDLLFFDGYVPHRSESNRSRASRRAMFLTYNRASEGDFHAQYYAAKHSAKQGFDKGKTISFQGDFLGKVVD